MKTPSIILLVMLVSMMGSAQDVLLKSKWLFESATGELTEDQEVLIKRGKIAEVGSGLAFDEETTTVIDLGEATLLPGLIECHAHLFTEELLHGGYKGFGETVLRNTMTESDATRALYASKRAKTYLDEGFTTVVDLGNSGHYLDVDLRDAINRGVIEGPRLLVSGPGIAAVGGQLNGVPYVHHGVAEREYSIVSGLEEARKAIREHALMRVDLIKVYADNLPNKTALSVEELKLIVDEAAEHGLLVTAHAITEKAIQNAAKAGIKSIEHAYGMSDSTLAMVIEQGITVVPTYSDGEVIKQMYRNFGIRDTSRLNQIAARGIARQNKNLKRLFESDVKIAFGSDIYSKVKMTRGKSAKHGLFSYLLADMPLHEAIQTATHHAAAKLGKSGELGIIAEGAIADIIAVPGNALDGQERLQECLFIMKGGKIISDKSSS